MAKLEVRPLDIPHPGGEAAILTQRVVSEPGSGMPSHGGSGGGATDSSVHEAPPPPQLKGGEVGTPGRKRPAHLALDDLERELETSAADGLAMLHEAATSPSPYSQSKGYIGQDGWMPVNKGGPGLRACSGRQAARRVRRAGNRSWLWPHFVATEV